MNKYSVILGFVVYLVYINMVSMVPSWLIFSYAGFLLGYRSTYFNILDAQTSFEVLILL